MKLVEKILGAVTASLLVLAVLPNSANADPLLTTFTFTGQCDDCASAEGLPLAPGANLDDDAFQAVSGTLVLKNFPLEPPIFDLSEGDSPTIGNIVLLPPLSLENFVSFHYDGSTLLNPFTVIAAPSQLPEAETNGLSDPYFALSLSGVLDPVGNVLSNFSLFFSRSGLADDGDIDAVDTVSLFPADLTCGQPEAISCHFFVGVSGLNGFWSIGNPLNDVGTAGTFADIPEPGTLALFGLGLAGLGLARRRKTA